jgi:hypothetical protein
MDTFCSENMNGVKFWKLGYRYEDNIKKKLGNIRRECRSYAEIFGSFLPVSEVLL